jgi:hypothetical protein
MEGAVTLSKNEYHIEISDMIRRSGYPKVRFKNVSLVILATGKAYKLGEITCDRSGVALSFKKDDRNGRSVCEHKWTIVHTVRILCDNNQYNDVQISVCLETGCYRVSCKKVLVCR